MNIFEYSKYNIYLRDWLKIAKSKRLSSALILAKQIRVHPTFLSQVIKGNKDLSIEHWLELLEIFSIGDLEKDFLHYLYLFNRAGTTHAKSVYKIKMDAIKQRQHLIDLKLKKHHELSGKDQLTYYSSWLYAGMHLMTAVGSGKSLAELAETFNVSLERTAEIVNFLLACGLCRKEGHLIGIGMPYVHIPTGSPLVDKHHLNWRILALSNLEKTANKELHFTAPMTISKKDFLVIREKISAALVEMIDIAKDSPAEDLAVLTIDFILPL